MLYFRQTIIQSVKKKYLFIQAQIQRYGGGERTILYREVTWLITLLQWFWRTFRSAHLYLFIFGCFPMMASSILMTLLSISILSSAFLVKTLQIIQGDLQWLSNFHYQSSFRREGGRTLYFLILKLNALTTRSQIYKMINYELIARVVR